MFKKKANNEPRVVSATGEIRKRRRRAGYRPWIKMFARLLIVAALIFLIYLIWKNWNTVAPESLLDWTQTQFGDGVKGEGYPRTVAGESVTAMKQANRHLTVLTGTTIEYMDKDAGVMVSRRHSLNEPTLQTAGRYVLLTEIGGSRFCLETRRGVEHTVTLENRTIYAASVNDDGMVAVITDSDVQSHLCAIKVYNNRGTVIFEYKCSKYLLTNLSLSPSGKRLAAIGVNAQSGAFCSALLLFDLSKDSPKELTGTELPIHVTYFNTGTVLVTTQTGIWTATASSDAIETQSFDGMQLLGYTASGDQAAVVLRPSSSAADGVVRTYGSRGKLQRTYPFSGTFRSFCCEEDRLLVLTDSLLFSFEGETEVQISTPSDSRMVADYDGDPILLTLGDIRRLKK